MPMPESTEYKTAPVGHPTLVLADLAPKKPSFSPNLYRWARERAHFYNDGGIAEGVWRVKPGTRAAEHFGSVSLFIGYAIGAYAGDTDFSGARLIAVLCQGKKEGRYCFAGLAPDLELVEGFWDRYTAVGRCAIDPDHQESFSGGERYRMDGETRTCLWCGAIHQRVLTPRTVMDESWVSSGL